MSPLQTFHEIGNTLAGRSFSFLPHEQQRTLVDDALSAIQRLRKRLDEKKLNDTIVYRRLLELKGDSERDVFDELTFLRHLTSFIALYQPARSDEDTRELLQTISGTVAVATKRALEEDSAIRSLQRAGRKMTDDEKRQSDLDTIQKVGIFYVLEPTLQILFEFTRRDDATKEKLVKEGLKINEGALPPLAPEVLDGFRREFCFALFDPALRDASIRAFYDFQEILRGGAVKDIGPALKTFNLQLLRLFADKGLQKFHGAIYAPFGNDILMSALIETIQKIEL